MDEFPNLRNAPITEALIDLRVVLPEGKQVADLEIPAAQLTGAYPTRMEIKFGNVQFQFGQTQPAEVTHGLVGVRYSSSDGKNVFQCQIDGFTFSRLKPYETWESLHGEAMRLWRIYRKIAEPGRITRVAVRYINHLRLPSTQRLEEFLTAMPRVPPGAPEELAAFLTRSVVVDRPTGAIAIITQNHDREQQPDDGYRSVLLDIDAFLGGLDISAEADSEVEEMLQRLRGVKNRIFFGSITDRAKELFR